MEMEAELWLSQPQRRPPPGPQPQPTAQQLRDLDSGSGSVPGPPGPSLQKGVTLPLPRTDKHPHALKGMKQHIYTVLLFLFCYCFPKYFFKILKLIPLPFLSLHFPFLSFPHSVLSL